MAKDFKQIRAEGDCLLNEYKINSLDVLSNEEIKETRERLILDSEQFMTENLQSAKNIVDFIWKYCWYDVISAFKLNRKRFTVPELDQLQKFIHDGIDYFEALGSNRKYVQYRCLLYVGDLLRYEHKLIKTEDDVLERAEESYKKAVELEPQNGSSYLKLACIYDSKSPNIALNFQLRAITNQATSAIGSLQKLSSKNVPSTLLNVFTLSQSAFMESGSDFQSSLDNFKQFFDDYFQLPATIIIQNLYSLCLLTMAIESVDEKYEEKLKLLVPCISQYFNLFIPILIEQLNNSEILKERRNCPSPFEDETCDLDEAYSNLGFDSEPTLYENVLFPVIPMILTLNEWSFYLSKWLTSIKLSVGSRMMCQSVLYNFVDLLNCFIDILGYRVQEDSNNWPKTSKWLSTNPLSLKKSQAFHILIDCLKKSISAVDHPLDFDTKFKSTSSGKEVNRKETKIIEFIPPTCLIASQESILKHYSKILFVLNSLKSASLLISSNTLKQLEQKIQKLHEKCLIYDEDKLGSLTQIAKMINEDNEQKVYLIVEELEIGNELNSKDISCCSADELYNNYCDFIGLNLKNSILPFLINKD